MAKKDHTHKLNIQFIFLLSLGSTNVCGVCCWFCIGSVLLWFHHFSDKQKLPLCLFMASRLGSFRSSGSLPPSPNIGGFSGP